MAVLCVAEVTTGGAPQQAWWGVAVETWTWCTAGGMEAGVAAVERVWRVLKKLKELLQDPATSGYRPIRTKRDENSCLQTHVHLVDYYSALPTEERPTPALVGQGLEGRMPRERSQSDKERHCDSTRVRSLEEPFRRHRDGGARGWGQEAHVPWGQSWSSARVLATDSGGGERLHSTVSVLNTTDLLT